MHRNSCAAYFSTDFSPREKAIIKTLTESAAPLTDRECAQRLGVERCIVQPRISELIERHVLCEAGDVRCSTTGKTVRTVALAVAVQQAI